MVNKIQISKSLNNKENEGIFQELQEIKNDVREVKKFLIFPRGVKKKGVEKNVYPKIINLKISSFIGYYSDSCFIISLNSNGNLVIVYSGSQSQIVNGNNLTDEQKEVKSFFQQVKQQGGETYFNRSELEEVVNQETNQEKDKNGDNKWLGPVLGIGVAALIIGLIGVVIYKNKKKNY